MIETLEILLIASELKLYMDEKGASFRQAWTEKGVIKRPQNKQQRLRKKQSKIKVRKQIKDWR